jgi:hypothetical protein
VYDNQFVREIAVSGVLGFALLVIAIIVGLRRGDVLSRLCLGVLVLMFFSFDALTWRSVAIIFVLVCSGPVGGRVLAKDEDPPLEVLEPPGQSIQNAASVNRRVGVANQTVKPRH